MKYEITESKEGCIIKDGGCTVFTIVMRKGDVLFGAKIDKWCKDNFESESYTTSRRLYPRYKIVVSIFNDYPENIMAFKLMWV